MKAVAHVLPRHPWLNSSLIGEEIHLRLKEGRLSVVPIDLLVEAIREDLGWLGIEHDGEERQSARLGRYAEAKARLAPYKGPRAVQQVPALPRNAMGKVTKPALKHLVSAA